MKPLDWKAWPLAVKLGAIMVLMVSIAIIGVTLLSIRREEENFRHELEQQALLVLDTMELTSIDAMYKLDVNYLQNFMGDIGTSETGVTGRIYDAEGRVMADTETGDQIPFDTQVDPLGGRLVASDAVQFNWDDQQLLAGKGVSAGSQHLGAISITLPTAPVLAKIDAVRNQGIVVAVIGVVIGAVLAVLIS